MVRKLRKEARDSRTRAKAAEARAEELARALFQARTAAFGKLADGTDLEFNPDLLDDPDAHAAAIDELLTAKPHLASRTPRGNVGQGAKDTGGQPDSLLSHLKSLA